MTIITWPSSTAIRRPNPGRKKPKSGTKRQAPERAIQTAIVKALRKHAKPHLCRWFAVPNGGHRHLYTATKLKAEGTQRGTPDLCFVLPPRGRIAFLELKSDTGRLSPAQIEFRDDVTALGALYAVAHSTDEAWGVLAAWGVLPSAVHTQTVLD